MSSQYNGQLSQMLIVFLKKRRAFPIALVWTARLFKQKRLHLKHCRKRRRWLCVFS